MSEKPRNNHEESDDEPTIEFLIERVGTEYLEEDDAVFLRELVPEDQIGYLYGRLLESGEDPDEILIQYGIIEREENL